MRKLESRSQSQRGPAGGRRWAPWLVCLAAAAAWTWPAPSGGPLAASAQAGVSAQDGADAPDLLIFNDGRTVKGKVLEETATTVRMRVVFRGIVSETTYPKADIASIKRGANETPGVPPRTPPAPERPRAERTPAAEPNVVRSPADEVAPADAVNVYLLELTGQFGKDISQTPVRDAVADAEKLGADYMIVKSSNRWTTADGLSELTDDVAAFDQLFRAEDIAKIFYQELPREWREPARVVFWVDRAMGGAAFLPLISPDIYFTSDGKMGGIGNLGQLFDQGDEVVKEKQFSLRLASAKGLAERGGHPTQLVEAMARREYVLWARYRGGEVVFIDNPALVEESDTLLTDDGEGENEDTDEQIVREQGNDVLTLNADLAFNLGLSDGTVDTLDDLLFELGIERQARVLEGRSERIMERWRRQVKGAENQLEELWEEFNEAEIGGDERERARGRGTRIRKAEDMIGILRRFEEAINPGQIGVPGIAQLEQMIDQLRLDQLADRN